MSRPLPDEVFDRALERAVLLFSNASPLIERNRYFLFVCGGAHNEPPNHPTMRQMFLAVASTILPGSICLLAEDAAGDATLNQTPRFIDLGDFERILVEIADAVILFCESPGSIAELGYFCANEKLLAKIFVIRDNTHANGESFINNGLVTKVNSKSTLQPAASVDASSASIDFNFVADRIKQRIRYPLRRRPFSVSEFSIMPFHDQFIFLHWIIYVVGTAKYGQIVKCIKIFCKDAKVDLDSVLSALCATGLVLRGSDDPSHISFSSLVSPMLRFKDLASDEIRSIFLEAEQRVDSNVE